MDLADKVLESKDLSKELLGIAATALTDLKKSVRLACKLKKDNPEHSSSIAKAYRGYLAELGVISTAAAS